MRTLPLADSPEFWPTVWRRIDEEFEAHKDAVKDWPLIWEIPVWSGEISFAFLNYAIQVKKGWDPRPRHVLAEPNNGHSPDSYRNSVFQLWDYYTTAWRLEKAYSIMAIEKKFDLFSYDHIIEIGGGIGELAQMIYSYGYTGGYTIYDHPSMLKVSKAFLKDHPIYFTSDMQDLWAARGKTLVIATWSLSEIPFPEREKLCLILAGCDFFVIFQGLVFQLDNLQWFPKRFEALTHTEMDMEWLDFHLGQWGSFMIWAKAK